MKLWIVILAGGGWLGAALACHAQPSICIGIGAARIPGDEFPWQSRLCPPARADAEAAFRELVPGAASEQHLYSYPIRWAGPGVLLTDGVTDNRSIPVTTRILRECSELVKSGGEGMVVWMAGIGEIDGPESWLYDRMGNVLPIASVLNEVPDETECRVIVRAYADGGGSPAHTLYYCDAESAAALLEWAEAGGRDRGILPGLSWLLETITPIRRDRLRDQLGRTGERDGGRTWLDLGQSLERSKQVVALAVDMRERPVFRTKRRPGPFFTIVEEETDEVIGTKIQVNTPRLSKELGQKRLLAAAVDEVVERVEAGAAASFDAEFEVGPNTYTMVYDREAREVEVRYLD